MAVRINTGAVIHVEHNGRRYPIPVEDWYVEEPIFYPKSDDGMGGETEYRFSIDGYIPQNASGNVAIDAWISIWEYPTGIIETTDASQNVDASDVGDAFSADIG